MSSAGGLAATPNLDRVAHAGLRFDFAHAHAVVTLPSHASILTGMYPFEHGIRDNTGYRLAPDAMTIATVLQAAGFATSAFVGAFPLDSRFGLNAGFDVYSDRFGASAASTDFDIAERPGEAVVAEALAWIRERREPWFAWVHVFDPHAAYGPPPPFDRQYPTSPYHGEVAYVDRALGPLFDAAREPGGLPTFVVVTSDHGEGLGDHGELTHGLFAYESTLHVPLIVAQLTAHARFPTTPRVSSVPARHIDILPTVLDALGFPPLPTLPGRSLLPDAPDADATAPRTSYFEAMSASLNRGWAPLTGVMVNRHKYIELPLPELFDLAVDPTEQLNLVDRDPERQRTLTARLGAFEAAPPGARQRETADAVDRLRSLGYVVGRAPARTAYTEADDPKRLADIDSAIHRSIDLYQRGRPREAAAISRDVIATRPGMAIAYRHLRFLHWSLGEVGTAVETLRGALERGLVGTAIQTQLGVYLAETGATDEAIPLLEGITADAVPEWMR